MTTPLALLLALPAALAADVQLGFTQAPAPGENPALLVTPPRAVEILAVDCTAGGQSLSWEERGLPGGGTHRFEWIRDESVTHADCSVQVRYADGAEEGMDVPVDYSYGGGLAVDLSGASADLKANTLTVSINQPVQKAKITALGPLRAVLSQQEIAISGGPGPITVPWVGDASEVVLLEVELHNALAWAGFTFSPWFLEIPHDEVLFDTNDATIHDSEAPKLERTLRELEEVLVKYGDIVPVKLFIAGCTDTVGDAGANAGLSQRRARAIAGWLREHGYSHPIYYYGFGESYLAEQTGDEVDSQANRRAPYYVGATEPPPSTGVPQVSWIPL